MPMRSCPSAARQNLVGMVWPAHTDTAIRQERLERTRVLERRAFRVVVEEHVHRLNIEPDESIGPAGELGAGVPRRPRGTLMEAHVRPIAGDNWGDARVRPTGEDPRGARRPETVGHGRLLPRSMTELDGHPDVVWDRAEQPVERIVVSRERRRELHEQRTEPLSEWADDLQEPAEVRIGVTKATDVRHVPAELHGEDEPGRGDGAPSVDHRGRRQPIEGGVQLDRREPICVPGQPLSLWKAMWVHPVTPVTVGPPARSHPCLHAWRRTRRGPGRCLSPWLGARKVHAWPTTPSRSSSRTISTAPA